MQIGCRIRYSNLVAKQADANGNLAFVSYHPYFGSVPRSVETWSISTLRIGATFKFGRGSLIPVPVPAKVEVVVTDRNGVFCQLAPEHSGRAQGQGNVPLRNYVFFNIGSTQIPTVMCCSAKISVKDFKEDQLEVFAPKKLSGRSGREMTVYYNVLNILGDRMGKNPSTTITWSGRRRKARQMEEKWQNRSGDT